MKSFFCLLTIVLFSTSLFAQQDDATKTAWNQPVEPFRIIGNIYYVGAVEVTSYLFVTPQGMILLDGGFDTTAPQIVANIRKLGFDPHQVKYLINTHAHFDHAGGLAELKRATGARLYASAQDSPELESGDRGDFAFGDRLLFPAVHVDHQVRDGEKLSLGGTTLTANVTAGHTKGCTSWSLDFEEDGAKHRAVFVCSLSMPGGYKLVNNQKYPQIAEDYKQTFQKLESLHPDVFLGSHASFFDLETKRAKQLKGGSNPFIDSEGYRQFVEENKKAFLSEFAKQQKRNLAADERR